MFAAIYIPDFPVEAIVRAAPELREQAVAVVEGAPPRVYVVAMNEKAEQAGVEPGITKMEAEAMVDGRQPAASSAGEGARATSASGAVRQRSAEREAAAHAALLDCACGFSPRVEDTAADTAVLDIAGLERIFGPPAKLARDIARRCSELGLETNVAVASNADTAVLAARGFAGVTVIAEGKEAERLGELSVEVLVAADWGGNRQSPVAGRRDNRQSTIGNREILETLERWGVRNLRALAALPEVAVAERLGQPGLHWQKLARGEVRRTLVVAEPPLIFEETLELEYPVDTLEPLAFVLNRMLEQLCARLAARALATNELKLRFELDLVTDIENSPQRHRDTEEVEDRRSGADGESQNGSEQNRQSAIGNRQCSSPFEHTLRLPAPMLDARVFLKLLQLDLQAHPPPAPVTKIWLRAEPAEPRRAQNGLFVPQAPEAEKLSVTLARIERVVGESTVDGRRSTTANQSPGAGCQDVRVGSPEILDSHRSDAFRMRKFVPSTADRRPSTAAKSQLCPLAALRVFRPLLAAVVTLQEGRPAHVASPDRPTLRGEVVWCAGPWRSSGEWWTEQAWSRAEWDIAVRNEEGVAVYRVYRDEMNGKWWVEGTYD